MVGEVGDLFEAPNVVILWIQSAISDVPQAKGDLLGDLWAVIFGRAVLGGRYWVVGFGQSVLGSRF